MKIQDHSVDGDSLQSARSNTDMMMVAVYESEALPAFELRSEAWRTHYAATMHRAASQRQRCGPCFVHCWLFAIGVCFN